MEPGVEERTPPAFDHLPEAQVIEEGETAKFKVRVKGNPRPKVNWFINGNIAVSVRTCFDLLK